MKKQFWTGALMAICLCSAAAQGYEGTGFSMDLPEKWDGPAEQEAGVWHGYSWYLESGEFLVVNMSENGDGVNLYDWDGEASQMLDDIDRQDLMRDAKNTLEENDLGDGVSMEDLSIALGALEDSTPCLTMDMRMRIDAEGTPVDLYASGVSVYSKAHQFVVECVALDPKKAQALLQEALPCFALTEEAWEGPTPEEPFWRIVWDSLLSKKTLTAAGAGGLIGGGAAWLWDCRKRKKQRETS